MATHIPRHPIPNPSRHPVRQAIDRYLSRYGYRQTRNPLPCDLRGLLDDPLDALARVDTELGQAALLDVPGGRCRGWPVLAFPLEPNSRHPFVMTVKQHMTGATTTYAESALHTYYTMVQPQNGAELLGVDSRVAGSPLCRLSPLEVDLPWRCAPGPAVRKRREEQARWEAQQLGYDLAGEDGITAFGPVSPRKAEFEYWRITALADSIAQHGYQADGDDYAGHIEAVILRRDDGQWQLLIKGGQHRAAALVALGYKRLPLIVRASRVVDRSAVEQWPGVRNGAFTVEQALAVFDRVFAGRQPAAVERVWPPRAQPRMGRASAETRRARAKPA